MNFFPWAYLNMVPGSTVKDQNGGQIVSCKICTLYKTLVVIFNSAEPKLGPEPQEAGAEAAPKCLIFLNISHVKHG
jgi:hypothetical protein